MFGLGYNALLSALLLFSELSCEIRDGRESDFTLKVFQANTNGTIQKKLIRLTEGHVLNLTCFVDGAKDVDLSWYVPSSVAKSQHRLRDRAKENRRNLVISPISEVDSGSYQCEAISSGEHLKESVRVVVEPDWGDCKPGFYNCNNTNNYCIPKRYRCDGRRDCPHGDDESEFPCGVDPCKGKISCPELDYRCIDPSEYCCDPETDYDCKVLYPCCEAVLDYNGRNKHKQHPPLPHQSGYDKIFWTAIGCCVVFIVVIGLVYGWLKYQSVKASRQHARQRPPITLHDLDLMYGGGTEEYAGTDRNLSITFNINHGVQILRPPPYSNRNATTGPPPPYMSQENVQDPLINQDELMEESNNNGDINGNSNVVDNNNPNRNMAVAGAEEARTAAVHQAAAPTARGGGGGGETASQDRPPPPPPPPYPGLDRETYSDSSETE